MSGFGWVSSFFRSILSSLNLYLLPAQQKAQLHQKVNPLAFKSYLQGRHQLNLLQLDTAIEYFDKAIELDKGFADENMDGIITADELGGFIKNRVMIDVEGAHTPQQGRIGSDMGEFVFISKNAEEQFAAALIADGDDLSDLHSEVVELKEKLRLKNIDGNTSFNMKTASTFSWVFPGLGHYYAGMPEKGVVYTGLELAALAGFFVANDRYRTQSENYNTAKTNYDNFSPDTYQGADPGEVENNLFNIYQEAYDDQQSAMYTLIGIGAVSAGIWIWNILDFKKYMPQDSYSENISIGINMQQQLEWKLFFR